MRELSSTVQEQIRKATAGVSGRAALKAERQVDPPGIPVGPRDAIVEACFLMAAVDGEVTPLEIVQFADAFETMFGADAERDVEAIVGAMAERLGREGWERRMRAVTEALSGTELAETAYRLVAAVAFVDDSIRHAEAAALDALATSLQIDGDRAHAILSEVHAELFGP